MSLIINQGKQDTSKDNEGFDLIVQNDATITIVEVTLNKFDTSCLDVKSRILNGANKNRLVFDRVCYDPNSAMSWKYRALRSAAGVPYQESEPTKVDIEKLLLNKVLSADLSIRAGKDKDGNPKDYQNIKYKKFTGAVGVGMPSQSQEPKPQQNGSITSVEEFDDDGDIPFKSAGESVVSSADDTKSTIAIDDWD